MTRYLLIIILALQLSKPLPVHGMEDGDTPVYIPTRTTAVTSPLLWLGGAIVIAAAGVGGYALGRALGDKDNEGPVGPDGPAGPRGLRGGTGGHGTYGKTGKDGAKGPKGAHGNPGSYGAQGTIERGSDPLCFYFCHQESKSRGEESIIALVTTPEGEQFTSEPIFAGTGTFTSINPLPHSPIGVYHLTIIPTVGGELLRGEVVVMKNNVPDATIPYTVGPYQAHRQITLNYIYHPTN